jgi:hypothetical protein
MMNKSWPEMYVENTLDIMNLKERSEGSWARNGIYSNLVPNINEVSKIPTFLQSKNQV